MPGGLRVVSAGRFELDTTGQGGLPRPMNGHGIEVRRTTLQLDKRPEGDGVGLTRVGPVLERDQTIRIRVPQAVEEDEAARKMASAGYTLQTRNSDRGRCER